jgi:hypothetical protein
VLIGFAGSLTRIVLAIIQLAILAKSLGFSTPRIDSEADKAPFESVIEKAVIETFYILRPNEKFHFDVSHLI